ncbi:hypothetical protein RIEGSTA812A_PEG_458 [invertebrate metagenome]|uniref:Uncharacterized protein n=1 Tax=invertebrate metagenome TaxID=1711999 RepID=A0A484H6K0_9ZZZZ
MDLPKYLHAVIFDERAFIEATNHNDRIDIDILGGARSVNITMNYRALATLITLIAEVLTEGMVCEADQKATLKEAIGKLASSVL